MTTLFTRRTLISAALLAASTTASALPTTDGFVSTDRFGYAGTILRYATEADARDNINSTDSINITDRDLSLFIANNDAFASDWNVIMGSWWYSIALDDNGVPRGDGWGNTNGNTGPGYMQLYDNDGSTDTNISMEFSNFDGTYYTQFNLDLTGENATRTDDFSRLSAYDNVNDGGMWYNYNLNLTATGLQGQAGSGGGKTYIQSTNHPMGVTGSFKGLFELTENQTSPNNQGFYAVDFTLNMDNWAWDNRVALTNDGGFADSTFRVITGEVPVPAPGVLPLLGIGLLGLLGFRRRNTTVRASINGYR